MTENNRYFMIIRNLRISKHKNVSQRSRGFPGSWVVKHLPVHAGDGLHPSSGKIPTCWGATHCTCHNYERVLYLEPKRRICWAHRRKYWSQRSLQPGIHKRSQHNKEPTRHRESGPRSLQEEQSPGSNEDSARPKINRSLYKEKNRWRKLMDNAYTQSHIIQNYPTLNCLILLTIKEMKINIQMAWNGSGFNWAF